MNATAENLEAPVVAPPRRRNPARIAGGIAVLFLLGGLGYFIDTFGEVSTDNAAIDGHVVTLATRVPGVVKEVRVKDNQTVKAGDVLVILDDADAGVRVRAAEADVAGAQAARDAAEAQLQTLTGGTAATLSGASAGVESARATVHASDAAIAQAQAALTSATARAQQSTADRARAESLLAAGAMTKQQYDGIVASDVSNQAGLAAAQAALANAQGNAAAGRGRLDEAQARYAQATTGDSQVAAAAAQLRAADARLAQSQANLDAARLQLSYTQLLAPFDGVVAKKNAEPGQVVGAGVGLVGLVGTDEVWVTANFKETDVANMKPGQKAEVDVDGVSGTTFEGTVQGLSSATGARFSLLPPDNSSGNFTKVVQRIPVRVDLGPDALGAVRPGMSAVVTVSVR